MRRTTHVLRIVLVFLLIVPANAMAWTVGTPKIVDDRVGYGFSYSGPTDGDSDPYTAYGGMNVFSGSDQFGGTPYGSYRHWSYIRRTEQSWADYYINGVWRPDLPYKALYNVYAWIPWNTTTDADYQIVATDGTHAKSIRQYGSSVLSPRNEWVLLGKYPFNAGTAGYVSLDNSSRESSWNIYDYLLYYNSQYNARCQVWDAIRWDPIYGEIKVIAYHDRNMNGTQDVGEAGVQGVSVCVDSGSWYLTTTDGSKVFTSITPTTHTVRAKVPSGWFATSPVTTSLTVYSEQQPTLKVGLAHYGTLSGYKFLDADGDGVEGANETTRLAGWDIEATPSGGGLVGEYFENYGAGAAPSVPAAPVYKRLDSTVNFDWGTGRPAVSVSADDFVVRWRGYVYAHDSGTYVFTAGSDDGCLLTVNGMQLVSEWKDRGYTENSASIGLAGGSWYPIEMRMYENGGSARATLSWLTPGATSRVTIPATALSSSSMTQTGVDGAFSLGGLVPGLDYRVTEHIPESTPAWQQTVPAAGAYTVHMAEGMNVSADHASSGPMVFGNWTRPVESYTISGRKFDDADADGEYDGGLESAERPIGGWAISLLDSEGNQVGPSEVTDEYGEYSFEDLAAGRYTVVEEDRAPWLHTTPRSVDVTLGPNAYVHFGNVRPGAIDTQKFHDRNCNGERDEGEELLDWEFSVDGGDFEQGPFQGLLPGERAVVEATASISGGKYRPTTPRSLAVLVSEAETATAVFGNVRLGRISGSKYHDRDGDGAWEDGEEGLLGWEIHLSGTNLLGEVVEDTTTTGVDGAYRFDGLTPGEYWLSESVQPGWRMTESPDSNGPIVLSAGDEVNGQDFGNVLIGSVSGYKFEDMNGDGIRSPDESAPPEGEWTIRLTGTALDGSVVDTSTVADSRTGWYQFPWVEAGEYTLSEVLPPGWTQTLGARFFALGEGEDRIADIGNFRNGEIWGAKWHDLDGDGVLDEGEPAVPDWGLTLVRPDGSTESTSTGNDGTFCFTDVGPGAHIVREEVRDGWVAMAPSSAEATAALHSGEVRCGVDFLNVKLSSISGAKISDLDGDGQRGALEPGVEGWGIYLAKMVDGVWESIDATETSSDGSFGFRGLMPGQYRLTEQDRQGWVRTGDPDELIIVGGSDLAGCEFLNVELASVCGGKYHDRNADGAVDHVTEAGVGGWRITLERQAADVWTSVGVTETVGDGSYGFEGLLPGHYRVVEEQLDGWESVVSPSEFDLIGGERAQGKDFLNVQLVALQGSKFADSNMDGEWQSNEAGVPGWTMRLEGLRDGQWESCSSTQTTESGAYQFDGLMPGTYRVVEEERLHWRQTRSASETLTVLGGDSLTHLDFGNIQLGQMRIMKWDDADADGVHGADEPMLESWGFEVHGTTVDGSDYSGAGVTGSDGALILVDLLPGSYEVEEEQRDLIIGSDGRVAQHQWLPTATPTSTIEVSAGSTATAEFGNIETGCVYGFVTHQVWGTPVAGIRVFLEETGQEAITDAAGFYIFPVLEPNGTAICPTPDYTVAMDLDGTGWKTSDAVDKSTEVEEGDCDRVDFTVLDASYGNQPRTIGYWKNWDNHFTDAEMEEIVARVRAGSRELADLQVDDVYASLQFHQKTTMEYKARAQFIAVWLNMSAGYLGFFTEVDLTSIDGWEQLDIQASEEGTTTVISLVGSVESYFEQAEQYTKDIWEIIKNILDSLNNALLT